MPAVNKSKGFTLIEVLVVVAIMSIVTTVMASILTRQMTDQTRVMQRAELNDLKTVVSMVMSDRDRCVAELNGVTFDAVNGTDVIPTTSSPINQILYDPATPASVVVRANQQLPGTQSGLGVKTIRLAKILKAYSGTQKPRFSAVIEIQVDPVTAAGSFHPVEVPITIYTDAPPGATSAITACSGTVATPQAACQAIVGATWDATNNDCVLPRRQCENDPVPSPDGQCNQKYKDPAVCPFGGHGGVFACTAVGWQCVNSECKTTATTSTTQTGATCGDSPPPPYGFCMNNCGQKGMVYCNSSGWQCQEPPNCTIRDYDDGDDDDGG